MLVSQKRAWYNLVVVSLSVLLELALLPVVGPGAQGGAMLLVLLLLSPLLFRSDQGKVSFDERDAQISRHSEAVAYWVFWPVVMMTSTFLPAFYGSRGSVPVSVVQLAVWAGLVVVVGVTSVVTLMHYGRENADAA